MKYEVSCAVTLYVHLADTDATNEEVAKMSLEYLRGHLQDAPCITYEHDSTCVTVDKKEPKPWAE